MRPFPEGDNKESVMLKHIGKVVKSAIVVTIFVRYQNKPRCYQNIDTHLKGLWWLSVKCKVKEELELE